MDPLLDLLAGRDESLDLDRAALEIARIEYPGLDFEPSLSLLDSLANELSRRLGSGSGGADYVSAANQYLFEDLGFSGNAKHYYDPRNSCLNDVLTERTGIPISLSVVYMEIARRLGKPIVGIGLPGHFLVAYRESGFSAFIDVFHGGRLLTPGECFARAAEATGAGVAADPRWLAPVSKRHIAIRMLQNLRGVYLQKRTYGKAARTIDLLLAAQPDGPDRAEMQTQLRSLRRYQAGLN